MASGKKSGRKSQGANDFLAPYAPTGASASDVGTARPFNNAAASVTFTADSRNTATSFTVTSSPGGYTGTGSSSPVTVAGLLSNTSYTFTVTATNAYGTSESSAATSALTVTSVPATPGAPTVSSPTGSSPGVNSAGTTTDDISWSAPSNGGRAITGYSWASDDGKSGSTASTSVTGIAQEGGTSQSYRVYATNANGNSEYSAYSSAITTFSFTPFSAFGFTPFGAFGFTPFGAFGFTPFGAFGFTPWAGPSGCIHEDTLIDTTSGKVAAKDINVGDVFSTVNITEVPLEDVASSDWDWRSIAVETFTTSGLVEATVTEIIPSQKQEVIWFNEDDTKKYSLSQPIFVKGSPFYIVKEAGDIAVGDCLILINNDGSYEEVPVVSMSTDDTVHNVYQFSCEPQDWFIAGGYLVHNK
jgi:hypothetical protein